MSLLWTHTHTLAQLKRVRGSSGSSSSSPSSICPVNETCRSRHMALTTVELIAQLTARHEGRETSREREAEKEERASKRVNERERSDPQNATCCMRWGTGHTVNLFVLSVAKSRALNSRFVEGVEKAFAQRKREGE